DMLVCPTHARRVVAVNRGTGKVLWTHEYRPASQPAAPPANVPLRAGMRPSLHVHDSKVVFAAADDPAVHCLSLSDGKRLWKADMNDDLYLAGVFGNAVLLVGKKHCRALRLSDGESLWEVETGVASGHGIALGQVYYLLPLAAEATTGKPGISVLSLKT